MAVLEKSRGISGNPPPLQHGDVLARGEFLRRYAAMPGLKKAELIEGIVYMASPVRADLHGIPHVDLATLLRVYATKHPGLLVADNATVRLDTLNEPQPDLLLIRENGQARVDADGYISGAPEFIAEIAASSASYDLHQKMRTYLRAGVLEYLVWLAYENRLIWWRLRTTSSSKSKPTRIVCWKAPHFRVGHRCRRPHFRGSSRCSNKTALT